MRKAQTSAVCNSISPRPICQQIAFIFFIINAIHSLNLKYSLKIGYAIAYHFIQECYKRGKKPYWDSLERNLPSWDLSKKPGFIEVNKYPITSWTYN